MSQNHPDARRAAALRRRLIAVASVCASSGVALPTRAELAYLTGASLRQIHRHIPALRDTGALATERRAGRLYVQEVRP
jgi:DNA-binding transcriptional regulator YhcF (GntR family)